MYTLRMIPAIVVVDEAGYRRLHAGLLHTLFLRKKITSLFQFFSMVSDAQQGSLLHSLIGKLISYNGIYSVCIRYNYI